MTLPVSAFIMMKEKINVQDLKMKLVTSLFKEMLKNLKNQRLNPLLKIYFQI